MLFFQEIGKTQAKQRAIASPMQEVGGTHGGDEDWRALVKSESIDEKVLQKLQDLCEIGQEETKTKVCNSKSG